MPSIQQLIKDEQEAVEGYEQFLKQEPHSKRVISKIHKIIRQEQNHIKILRKI